MRDFGLALKLYFKGFLDINKAKYSQDPNEKKRARTTLIMLVVLSVVMTCMYSFVGVLYGREEAATPLLIALGLSFVLTLASGIGVGLNDSLMFKDHDMLMSMPIKKGGIVASRVFMMYLNNLTYLMMFLPGCIVACVLAYGFDVALLVRILILALLIPAVPTALSTALGIGVMFIATKFNSKNTFQTISALLIMVLVLVLVVTSMNSNSVDGNPLAAYSGLAGIMLNIYPPATWFRDAIMGDMLGFALFTAISVAAIALTIWLITLCFTTLREKMSPSSKKGSKYSAKDVVAANLSGALLRREAKKYFSMPLYVTNTLVGPIIIILVTAAVVIFNADIKQYTQEMPMLLSAIPFIGLFTNLMTSISTVSISSEGSNMWLLKSIPVPAHAIVKSKARLHMLIVTPANIVAAVVLPLALGFELYMIPILLLFYTAAAAFCTYFGLLTDMRNPRFDWKSEQEIVKQGANMAIVIIVNMLVSLVCIFVGVGLPLFGIISQWLVMLILAALLSIVAFILYKRLANTSEMRLLKMN